MSTLLNEDTILDESILDGEPLCESVLCSHYMEKPAHPAHVRARFACGNSMLWCTERVVRNMLSNTISCFLCGTVHTSASVKITPL
ncbi:hypothetical protein ACSBPH_01735 [Microbacterium sp. F51-2R]|jgi:hypothetical protein|uniref:hypothetical protein n=1 Tax=Microbacterium sp. F51-2R TaxID=3445777 RepID=UPI003FA0F1C9